MIQYRIVWNDRILYHITCYHSTIFTFLAWYDIISYRLIQYHIIQNVNNMIQYILYHIILYNYYTILYHMIFNQLINTSYWLPMWHLVFIKVVHLNYFKKLFCIAKKLCIGCWQNRKEETKRITSKLKQNSFSLSFYLKNAHNTLKCYVSLFQHFKNVCAYLVIILKKLIRFLIFEFVLIKYLT